MSETKLIGSIGVLLGFWRWKGCEIAVELKGLKQVAAPFSESLPQGRGVQASLSDWHFGS